MFFCIIQFTYTVCVCVCVFVSSIFYYVNTTRVILIIYICIYTVYTNKENTPLRCGDRRGVVFSEKQFIFLAYCTRSIAKLTSDTTPKNVIAFLFTYFIYIQTIIIIVSPRPLHAHCNTINMLQYYLPPSIRDLMRDYT